MFTVIVQRSRPLWGIYISIQDFNNVEKYLMTFSSPMEYLYFYSDSETGKTKTLNYVLVPYGVSIFLFELEYWNVKNENELFSSPMGYLYFYSR